MVTLAPKHSERQGNSIFFPLKLSHGALVKINDKAKK